MERIFNAPGGIFVYPFTNSNGTEEWLVLRPGDQVTINGIEVTISIEYINVMYSIIHRSELNDEYYWKELDRMFESKKSKKNYGSDGCYVDPLEILCSRDTFFTVKLNHGRKVVLKKGKQTRRLAPALEALERIKESLSPKELDLFYSIYGCGMKQTEYAQLYGLKKTAINNRIKRFNEKIRKLLAEEGIDDEFFI